MFAEIVESCCPVEGRWTSGALGILLQRVAARPSLWEDALVRYPDQRWFDSLFETEDVELRAYTWPRGTFTQLHDHGGSIGAYAVVEGSLTEDWVCRGTIRRRGFVAGRAFGFGAGHIHDVRNESVEPAVSIHAYSPPLRSMTYYDVVAGVLTPVRVAPVALRPVPVVP